MMTFSCFGQEKSSYEILKYCLGTIVNCTCITYLNDAALQMVRPRCIGLCHNIQGLFLYIAFLYIVAIACTLLSHNDMIYVTI